MKLAIAECWFGSKILTIVQKIEGFDVFSKHDGMQIGRHIWKYVINHSFMPNIFNLLLERNFYICMPSYQYATLTFLMAFEKKKQKNTPTLF